MSERNEIGDRAAPRGDCEVWFIDDVAAFLRISRATIERRRATGSFPIPELPPLDKRPRWSRKAVEQFLTKTVADVRRAQRKAA
jgi:hypothetical protein